MRFPFPSKKSESAPSSSGLSPSLEDYLETIYDLSRDGGAARVKDIAGARNVKAASVSVALMKLAELGHIHYEPRGSIRLTESGLSIGRKMLSRHNLLCRFFADVLQLPTDEAVEQACAMEHSLTDSGMNQLVRFFEFLESCPDVGNVIERFHACPRRHAEFPGADGVLDGCTDERGENHCSSCPMKLRPEVRGVPLTHLKEGARARVTNVIADGALRQRLLDMGLLPRTLITLERLGAPGDPVWVRCMGAQLILRRIEAESVFVIEDWGDSGGHAGDGHGL